MKEEFNPFSLKGKTIVIIGASSGIGRQCAIDCSRMGAKIIMVARNIERLKETLSELSGDGHTFFSIDITDVPSDFINKIVADHGLIDGLIYAAGIEKTMPSKHLKIEDYEEIMKTNTFGAFEIVRQLSRKNFLNERASIIFISSISSLIGRKGIAAYAASKGALNSASRVFALEFAKKKIRVNCIQPGTILTPMMKEYLSTLSKEEADRRISGFPLGLGNPDDISNCAIYLLSDASQWVTGQNLIVDGGYTAQ